MSRNVSIDSLVSPKTTGRPCRPVRAAGSPEVVRGDASTASVRVAQKPADCRCAVTVGSIDFRSTRRSRLSSPKGVRFESLGRVNPGYRLRQIQKSPDGAYMRSMMLPRARRPGLSNLAPIGAETSVNGRKSKINELFMESEVLRSPARVLKAVVALAVLLWAQSPSLLPAAGTETIRRAHDLQLVVDSSWA